MAEWNGTTFDCPPDPIKIIGIGTLGIAAVDHMIDSKLLGSDYYPVQYLCSHTDEHALQKSKAAEKVWLSQSKDTEITSASLREAVQRNRNRFERALRDICWAIIVADIDDAIGVHVWPLIAEIARDACRLTIGVVTAPHIRELSHSDVLIEFEMKADSIVVIPSKDVDDNPCKPGVTPSLSAEYSVSRIHRTIAAFVDPITKDGLVGVDFEDIATTVRDMGTGRVGIGTGRGENRGTIAAQSAIQDFLEGLNKRSTEDDL